MNNLYFSKGRPSTSKTHRVKKEEKDHQLLWDAHKHHIIVDLKSVRPNSSVPQSGLKLKKVQFRNSGKAAHSENFDFSF